MEILVVRHGQSIADLEYRHEGRADFELTELGCRQARNAAKWIKEHYEIDIILSSPLKRTAKTSEFISEETDADINFEDELMEWNNGLLAGLLRLWKISGNERRIIFLNKQEHLLGLNED